MLFTISLWNFDTLEELRFYDHTSNAWLYLVYSRTVLSRWKMCIWSGMLNKILRRWGIFALPNIFVQLFSFPRRSNAKSGHGILQARAVCFYQMQSRNFENRPCGKQDWKAKQIMHKFLPGESSTELIAYLRQYGVAHSTVQLDSDELFDEEEFNLFLFCSYLLQAGMGRQFCLRVCFKQKELWKSLYPNLFFFSFCFVL